MTLVYNYSYGNEDVLSISIKVFKLKNDKYKVEFVQTGDFPESFEDMTSNYKIINKEISDLSSTTGTMCEKTITMIIHAPCNPRPENIFEII
jgi:hypothetical protein